MTDADVLKDMVDGDMWNVDLTESGRTLLHNTSIK